LEEEKIKAKDLTRGRGEKIKAKRKRVSFLQMSPFLSFRRKPESRIV
jgi:hypothetical protein